MRRHIGLALACCAFLGLTGPLRAQASLILLARHAEKAASTGDPGLTPAGDVRAQDLARALSGVSLAGVVATQYQRTQLTAAPTARANHITPVIVSTTGGVKEHAAAIAKVVDALPAGTAVLIVGHSNTLGPILQALGGPAIPEFCDNEYSTLLTLYRPGANGRPQLLRTRFGATEPPEAAICDPKM